MTSASVVTKAVLRFISNVMYVLRTLNKPGHGTLADRRCRGPIFETLLLLERHGEHSFRNVISNFNAH